MPLAVHCCQAQNPQKVKTTIVEHALNDSSFLTQRCSVFVHTNKSAREKARTTR